MELECCKAEMKQLVSSSAASKEDLEAKLTVATSGRAVAEEKNKELRAEILALGDSRTELVSSKAVSLLSCLPCLTCFGSC